jgi:Flp pilus assembly protein TadD/glutathione synthase/RimK-type ligase-like ATP-grasp enzyme
MRFSSSVRIASRHYSDESTLADIDERLEHQPESVDAHFERACALEDLGWDTRAMESYLAVLKRDPTHLGALTNLGLMMRERGDAANARAMFTQALTHHPKAPIAYVNLGQSLVEQGFTQSAIEQFEAALAIEPDFFAAHHGLALLYESLGDEGNARRHLERAFEHRVAWTLPYAGTAPPVRVLLLVSGRGGDIVSHPFLDDRVMQTTMFVPDGFREGMALPVHDIVFNGIGDVDRCRPSLERARALLARSGARVINAPERVLASGRAEIAARFASIAGTTVPRTERVARETLTADYLAGAGWTYPVLVRAFGFQAGRYFEAISSAESVSHVVGTIPGDDLLVIAFAETRRSDGFFRKYRVLFIGGELYPVHLAISRHWKVHYFSAGMEERAEHRAEEQRFLADMTAVLGLAIIETLADIAATLGLDYGGIDFGIDGDGSVVIFEVNATMAVYPPLAGELWAYRRPAYDAVVRAVRELMLAPKSL